MTDDKLVKKQPTLGDLAPKGVDGRLWVKVIQEQLMSSKNGEPSNAELLYFTTVAHNTGLDPTTRQIYAIFRNVKQQDGTYAPRMTIQTGIDGFRVIAERTKKYAGSKEPEFEYDENFKITVLDRGTQKLAPNRARVSVRKIVDGIPYETTRTANWADYYPGDREGNMWKRFPETMLSKVAEAQALRAAFPNEMSGLYLDEEMQQAEVTDTGVELSAIRDQIANAKTYDDLMNIMTAQPLDVKNQIQPWVDAKAKELEI